MTVIEPVYGTFLSQTSAPSTRMNETSMDPRAAQRIIEDELALDGNPALNLASFVTTYMDTEAEELMMQGMRKNFIDLDEYHQTAELHNRCVAILANLFHAPPQPGPAVGTGCVGSSEAIMLAVLALKWKWKSWKQKFGDKDISRPNLVFGSNVQACLYFEIEGREAAVSPDCLVLTADRAKGLIDENTIGVVAILGSTFNGEFEDVESIHSMVVAVNKENGWNVPIHVDAASGGFIAPFLQPDLLWDFRLEQVKSINVSGHKFGLVYAGIGWSLWREPQDLPKELVFHVNYLGGDQASFTLNFSKGASAIIGQYYQFLRLGKQGIPPLTKGYTQIMKAGQVNAAYLRSQILAMGRFKIHDKQQMPLVAFSLQDSTRFTVYDIQDKMKQQGWIIPAYSCSKGAEGLEIMRIVVKQNLSRDLADLLIKHLKKAIVLLETQAASSTHNDAVATSRRAFAVLKAAGKFHSHSGSDSKGHIMC